MTRTLTLAADRMEGRIVVLIADDGGDFRRASRRAPKDARREGAIVNVHLDELDEPV
jgi:hypothetical protein